jgi:hypothetical protein
MDHPVGRSASDAFGPDFQGKLLVNGVQFIGAAVRAMGGVGEHPEFAGPGYYGSDAAFVAVAIAWKAVAFIEYGQVGIDAADLKKFLMLILFWLGGAGQGEKDDKLHEKRK